MKFLIEIEAEVEDDSAHVMALAADAITDRLSDLRIQVNHSVVTRDGELQESELTHVHTWAAAGVTHGELVPFILFGKEENKAARQYTIVLLICKICGYPEAMTLTGHWTAKQVLNWQKWNGEEDGSRVETEEGSQAGS